MERNCPRKNMVSGSGTGPPGVSAIAMASVTLDDNENTEFISTSEPEVLSSLPFGAIGIGEISWDSEDSDDEFFSVSYDNSQQSVSSESLNIKMLGNPPWDQPGHLSVYAPRRLGDCYAMQAEWILDRCAPYPGDDRYTDGMFAEPGWRFNLRRLKGSKAYLITDILTKFCIRIEVSLLDRPEFDLANWYAVRRSRQGGPTNHPSKK